MFLTRLFKRPGPKPACVETDHASDTSQEPPEDAEDYFSPRLLDKVDWAYGPKREISEKYLKSDLGKLWLSIPDGHKWLSYFPAYEKLFEKYRGKSIRVLEIGVNLGGSLILWKEYFGAKAQIVGIDIEESCQQYEDVSRNIHVRIGDQTDSDFLGSVNEEFGPFDIIIDDGSHIVSHQIASFNALFETGVKEGGLYMVEDLETSFWGDRTGQKDIGISFMDFAFRIVELMHSPYVDHDYSSFTLDSVVNTSITAPRIATLLEEVRFFDSIAAFSRARPLPPVVLNLANS